VTVRWHLIKRPLGIGRLADPPPFLVQYQPGPATLATLVSLEGERFRLVVAEGQNLDSQNLDSQHLPALEMPYGQFWPASGLRTCLNGWLTAGGPHHEVMNLGRLGLPQGTHRDGAQASAEGQGLGAGVEDDSGDEVAAGSFGQVPQAAEVPGRDG
jgi:L-fucose isomerase-like protein